MKKIYLLFIIALTSLTSCHYMLDTKPENAVTFTNYFENEKDIEALTFQIHGYLKTVFSNNDHVKIGEYADEMQSTSDNAMRELNQASILNSYNLSWKTHYDVIYHCNVMIDEVHRVKDITKERLDYHLGQAYFVKAFMYFQLTRIYGDIIITKNSTTTTPYATTPAINAIEEAIRCAKVALDLLPTYENSKNMAGGHIGTKQYGSKGSVAALLAHAYAWKGSIIDIYKIQGQDSKKAYEESIYWSSQLINKKVGTTYELEPTIASLCTVGLLKTGMESRESIFEYETDEAVKYPENHTPVKFYLSYPINKTHHAGEITSRSCRIKQSTVETMYKESDDRFSNFFNQITADTTSALVNKGCAYPWKWREGAYFPTTAGGLRWGYLKGNYIFWRLTDFYLLRAECNNKLGNTGLAVTDLNEIRSRANASIYPSEGESDLKYAIFKEREKELIMEGHRYYDIIRNSYWKTELLGGFKTLTDEEVREGALYLPISEEAFTLNDVLRQNRYWAKYE